MTEQTIRRGSPGAVLELLEAAASVLIVTHDRPDGDALGSGLALQMALTGAGRKADFALLSPWAGKYDFLMSDRPVLRLWEKPVCLADYHRVLVVDTCTFVQLEGLEEQLKAHAERIAVIDHHRSRDPIGAVQWIDTSAAACGQMVLQLIRQAGWSFNRDVAEALLVAIATDTGWFRFSNTTPEAMRMAAELIEAGVQPDRLYQQIYQNESPQRVKLGCLMLSTMELRAGGRLAVLQITQDMFKRAGANPADTEGLIDLPQVIGSVVLTVLLVERPDDKGVRLSFRSKTDAVDVDRIARRFGGGGHARASGAKADGATIESVRTEVIAACEEALGTVPFFRLDAGC